MVEAVTVVLRRAQRDAGADDPVHVRREDRVIERESDGGPALTDRRLSMEVASEELPFREKGGEHGRRGLLRRLTHSEGESGGVTKHLCLFFLSGAYFRRTSCEDTAERPTGMST